MSLTPSSQAQISGDSRLLLETGGPSSVAEDVNPERYRVHRVPNSRPGPARQPKAIAKPRVVPAEPVPFASLPPEMDRPEPTAPISPAVLSQAPEDALRLKLSFAPAYMGIHSASDYSYRRYGSDSPGGALGLELWPTPDFAIKLNYFTSLAASVAEGAAGNASLEMQKIGLGVRWRLASGDVQFKYGFDLQDVRERLSRDAAFHVGSATTGLAFALAAEISGAGAYNHTFAFGLEPLLVSTEDSGYLQVRSGNHPRAFALSGSLGGNWVLRPTGIQPKREAFFWRGEARLQRTLYGGDATQPDPLTGINPRDVSVTETTTIFYLGFSWGS